MSSSLWRPRSVVASIANQEQIDVPVLTREVPSGEVIAEGDISYLTIPVSRANSSIVRAPSDIAGHQARRLLRAGELIRTSDVKLPTVVAKGETVTMLFEAPGISLSFIGRAMGEGGMGESVPVLNPVSHRQIDAVVVGTGTVSVNGLPSRAAAAKVASLP